MPTHSNAHAYHCSDGGGHPWRYRVGLGRVATRTAICAAIGPRKRSSRLHYCRLATDVETKVELVGGIWKPPTGSRCEVVDLMVAIRLGVGVDTVIWHRHLLLAAGSAFHFLVPRNLTGGDMPIGLLSRCYTSLQYQPI